MGASVQRVVSSTGELWQHGCSHIPYHPGGTHTGHGSCPSCRMGFASILVRGQSSSDGHLGLAAMGKSCSFSASGHSRSVQKGGSGQGILFLNYTSGKSGGIRRYSEQPVITKALTVYYL